MNNFLKIALFVIPIIALITVPVVLHQYKNNSAHSLQGNSTAKSTSTNSSPMHAASKFSTSPAVDSSQAYDMPEPFAHEIPWSKCCGMNNPMNPAEWMQMMNTMMNSMQITQMIHQMTAMSIQMMNPHDMSHNNVASPAQPMSPEEYKKWYAQQQETMKMHKK
jgi:hypothetical protein